MWEVIRNACRAKEGMIRVKHVPAHLGQKGVDQGLLSAGESTLNERADTWATAAADSHAVPEAIRERAIRRMKLGKCIHRTAIDCLKAS